MRVNRSARGAVAEAKRTELSVGRERAILLGVITPEEKRRQQHPLAELESLADTANAEVVGKVVQTMRRVVPNTYIGQGKAEEVRELAQTLEADVIVCDSDLSPAQIRNLETITDTKVVDRSELILDIFATHARTAQARLQVELAQLEYTYPRLRHMWSHLSKFEGGIGTRGPGETQLETDRRLVMRRIVDLKKQLRVIDLRKQREVRSRGKSFTVGIVGYTNAGKSTLMNALTGAGVLVEDQLFATLDTRTRKWELNGRGEVLLSDTVGFIRKLPHHLVESFKATLEEALNADLLLHVIDVSQPDALEQVEAVMGVLEEIGCKDKPALAVFNKVDAVEDETSLHILSDKFAGGVEVSALRKTGLEELTLAVLRELQRKHVEAWVTMPAGEGRLAAWFFENGHVLEREDDNTVTRMRVRIDQSFLDRVANRAGVEIETVDDLEE